MPEKRKPKSANSSKKASIKPTAKKQSSKNSSVTIPKWMKVFVIGFATGFTLQFVPSLKAFTHETAAYMKSVEWTPPQEICNPSQPWSNPILEREGYTLSYDGKTKTANWVYEELTRSSCDGQVKRTNKFTRDPDLPTHLQASLADYKNSGFDRGHLAPAADHRSSEQAMKETFYLSNISPQEPLFNRGYWKNLEKHVRDLTYHYDVVRVVTGPLYLPHDAENGKRYVTYEVIGENDVAVPTHFFKVVAVRKGNAEQKWAYIIPNEPIDSKVALSNFQETVEKVEKVSGLIFN